MRMPPHEQVRLLSAVDILESLSPEELMEVGQRTPDIYLESEQVFINPWDEGEKLYILKRGRVQIYQVSPEGSEITLSTIESGNIFGEMALTGQHLSDVFARALEPSVISIIHRADLERIILSHPEVGLRLVRRLSELLREAEIRMADLVNKGVPARLASLILRLAETNGVMTKDGVKISTRYTHERLGTMIGAKRVAVSRAFNTLRRQGAVQVMGRDIYVKDAQALKRIADEER
jgi:CRP/FNR family cyclic AMP-dependent transcriptional regulator